MFYFHTIPYLKQSDSFWKTTFYMSVYYSNGLFFCELRELPMILNASLFNYLYDRSLSHDVPDAVDPEERPSVLSGIFKQQSSSGLI